MPTVRVRDAAEYPESARMLFVLSNQWFNHDFKAPPDRRLARRLKESLAVAVSLTIRSAFGVPFHLGQMRRLGVTDRGVMGIVGVTQMFSSPVDRTGVPEVP